MLVDRGSLKHVNRGAQWCTAVSSQKTSCGTVDDINPALPIRRKHTMIPICSLGSLN